MVLTTAVVLWRKREVVVMRSTLLLSKRNRDSASAVRHRVTAWVIKYTVNGEFFSEY